MVSHPRAEAPFAIDRFIPFVEHGPAGEQPRTVAPALTLALTYGRCADPQAARDAPERYADRVNISALAVYLARCEAGRFQGVVR